MPDGNVPVSNVWLREGFGLCAATSFDSFRPMEGHDIAVICTNGHLITWSGNSRSEEAKKHCERCGQPTIFECESCHSDIPGAHHSDYAVIPPLRVPSYCHNCGNPYPWTLKKLEAARELADELELEELDREQLKKSIEELSTDSPKTEVAAFRFKRIISKLGQEAYGLMVKVAGDVMSEAAKKSVGL